jgi:hypothetical protein
MRGGRYSRRCISRVNPPVGRRGISPYGFGGLLRLGLGSVTSIITGLDMAALYCLSAAFIAQTVQLPTLVPEILISVWPPLRSTLQLTPPLAST